MSLEPIERCSEAEDTGEADGGVLVARGDGAPLLEARPEPLDDVAVVVDPIRTSELLLVALGRDRGACTGGPDVLAEAVAGIAAVAHDPLGHAGQLVEERNGVRQFVGLPRGVAEGNGAPSSVGDHASLGAIAAT